MQASTSLTFISPSRSYNPPDQLSSNLQWEMIQVTLHPFILHVLSHERLPVAVNEQQMRALTDLRSAFQARRLLPFVGTLILFIRASNFPANFPYSVSFTYIIHGSFFIVNAAHQSLFTVDNVSGLDPASELRLTSYIRYLCAHAHTLHPGIIPFPEHNIPRSFEIIIYLNTVKEFQTRLLSLAFWISGIPMRRAEVNR